MGSSPTLGANFFAEVAELADAQDLKSCDPYRSYRFDPGLRHQPLDWMPSALNIADAALRRLRTRRASNRHRGVEQLVARRAHNPEAAGSNPVPATMTFTADDLTSAGRQRFCVFPGGDFLFCSR